MLNQGATSGHHNLPQTYAAVTDIPQKTWETQKLFFRSKFLMFLKRLIISKFGDRWTYGTIQLCRKRA